MPREATYLRALRRVTMLERSWIVLMNRLADFEFLLPLVSDDCGDTLSFYYLANGIRMPPEPLSRIADYLTNLRARTGARES